MALQLFSRKTARREEKPAASPESSRREPVPYESAEPVALSDDALLRCAQQGRFGYLLARRDQWADHPEIKRVLQSAAQSIDEVFAMVPEGFASLPATVHDEPGAEEISVNVEPFLLAKHAVTNAQFQRFVDDGGYGQLELWPQEIWPHLIDFVDRTGQSAPRYWRDGRHNGKLSDHPVVGICFYEASAYTQWAGYRLPTEAEWQMAATWRIRSAANVLRRYPWGDALDTARCNIWASGKGGTVPVDRYPEGAAPNQVVQLIGNVWEWTADEYVVTDEDGGTVVGDMRLSSIRGGAFDTYFAAQATGMFRTGLASLSRAHNVGFRCAMTTPGGHGKS